MLSAYAGKAQRSATSVLSPEQPRERQQQHGEHGWRQVPRRDRGPHAPRQSQHDHDDTRRWDDRRGIGFGTGREARQHRPDQDDGDDRHSPPDQKCARQGCSDQQQHDREQHDMGRGGNPAIVTQSHRQRSRN